MTLVSHAGSIGRRVFGGWSVERALFLLALLVQFVLPLACVLEVVSAAVGILRDIATVFDPGGRVFPRTVITRVLVVDQAGVSMPH